MIKEVLISVFMIALTASVCTAMDEQTGTITNESWKSGVPFGGIGCGKLEILTDGWLGYYTGNHNWDRPTGRLKGAFMAVHAESGGKNTARMLRLPRQDEYANVRNIEKIEYSGWYPTAGLTYHDADLPVDLRLNAWSSLIPNNIEDSSLPYAYFNFRVYNPGKESAKVTLLVSWPNLIGFGGEVGFAGKNNVYWNDLDGNKQHLMQNEHLKGLIYETSRLKTTSGPNTIGKYLLCTPENGENVRYIENFDASADRLPFWESFCRGDLQSYTQSGIPKEPAAAIAVTHMLKPGETRDVDFILVWHFPNHITTRKLDPVPSNERIKVTADTEKAFDGDASTRWTTDRPMLPGDTYTLDLGANMDISDIRLMNPGGTDHPLGYKIETSVDGRTWDQAAMSLPSSNVVPDGLWIIAFPARDARYLRIIQTGRSDQYFWSIYELELYDSNGMKIPMDNAAATASLVKLKYTEKKRNIGHFYSNRFSDPVHIADYVYRNRARLLDGTLEWQKLVRGSNLPSWLKLKLVNCVFTMYACGILAKNGQFTALESPVDMWGSTGTMDQRMSAHAFYTQMFPELDESELRLYAKCQDMVKPAADGRIPHFTGNIYEGIDDPNVSYGITDWPDLACSWVMQVMKLYRWTGDSKFLDDMWPHVKRALDWVESADKDGDDIPEGGSTYDYETLPRGAFCYTAVCYLGALRSGIDMAAIKGDQDTVKQLEQRFNDVQKSMMANLWSGNYFIKHLDPLTGKTNPDSFIAQLAGDWMSRLSASGRTLPPDITDTVMKGIISRHVKPFYPIPPMEVHSDGTLAYGKMCFILQHEPYVGCEAINEGYTDDGLEVIRRVYESVWVKNRNPWHCNLIYNAPEGEQIGIDSYMTSPTTWHVLNALSGTTLDLPQKTLYISPRTGKTLQELHMPVFFSRFWVWLDYVPAKKILKIKVIKSFGDPPVIETVAAEPGSKKIKLPAPFTTGTRQTLDLSGYIDRLILYPEPKSAD
ncbi:MAG: GH116 family glycosyl-hydrolase [Armatimonadota bacterium]